MPCRARSCLGLFFPDKEVIDDLVRTNLYTGGVAGISEGTSISLGYVAESYIDFGPIGMFPALFLIGLMFGRIYRGLLRWTASRGLLGMGFATGVLTGAAALETSFTKAFGGIAVALLVAVLLAAAGACPVGPHGCRADRTACRRHP